MASCEYDSGPESEFDFGDMQSGANGGEDTTTGPGRASRILKRPQRGQSSTNRNLVVQLKSTEGKPPLKVPDLQPKSSSLARQSEIGDSNGNSVSTEITLQNNRSE